MSILPPNWVRLAPNGTNLGLFKISFSIFVLFGANLTQFGFQICDPWPWSTSCVHLANDISVRQVPFIEPDQFIEMKSRMWAATRSEQDVLCVFKLTKHRPFSRVCIECCARNAINTWIAVVTLLTALPDSSLWDQYWVFQKTKFSMILK